MVGIRWPACEGAYPQSHNLAVAEGTGRMDDPTAHLSDDERSVAADSWSIKSEYGSLMDGDDVQRNADAVEALAVASLRPADYSSEKEEQDDIEPSVLGLQSHWDSAYADELTNFNEHGDAGEIWFGQEVMQAVANWVARLCAAISAGLFIDPIHGLPKGAGKASHTTTNIPEEMEVAGWNILDIGTGNGLFLHALAKQGFKDLTGIDYSDAAVMLARAVAERAGHSDITFVVDDVLETKLQTQYKLVTDKGTFDAIGLHPEGEKRRYLYWKAVTKLVAPGGLLVITSCNNTKDELVDEFNKHERSLKDDALIGKEEGNSCASATGPIFQYLDRIRTYRTFQYGGLEGSRVSTVAFIRRA